ncbi:MAG: division/cell wall cluster transcriptional repressor MraZ [Candidatus Sphingomonas phytovorans]|nr:division/cell wall cluster transcriptional repressor MraZ [Sphingomonas sp.]WEJ99403.1 MAG: division/cell wall cluster transcriptional repressor MraZ [Sphingomonas sp.]
MDELFIGSAICEMTSGGEILLPRSFHETARQRAMGGQLFVGLHEESRCLVVYDKAFAAQQQWDFDTRRAAFIGSNLDAHYTRLRRTFGFVEEIMLAPDGMMTLGPLMRERGNIGDSVLLVATGQRFEIWDLEFALSRGPSELMKLASLHLKIHIANEERHVPALSPVESRRRAASAAQPGLRVQQMPAVRPRHDPILGVVGDEMANRARGI